ncbi:MAG TPA: hypothetical protein VK167_04615 [Flavipsychrobacter sp.]|nr:hypothetical protein [Flavipsychrobacter sp.]
MKGLIAALILLTSICAYSQSVYNKSFTYTLDKHYDTVARTEQIFDSTGRIVLEKQTGRGYKNQVSTFSYNNLSGNGLTVYKNGDSLWSWLYYADDKLSIKRTTLYNASKQQWEDTLVTTYTYNDAGNIIEELIWHKKNVYGDIILNTWNTNRIIYSYDNLGKLLSKKTYYIYSLNDWDRELLKSKTDRLQDTIKLTATTYNYNTKGYTRINYNINNIDLYDTAYVKYEFDKFNRIIKETERTESILSASAIRTYSYHPEKRIDREIYYNAADKLQRVKIYVYE